MAWRAVAEIDAPRERGRNAVGVIGEPREETTETADGDASSKWGCERDACRAADAVRPFVKLDRDDAPRDPAGDAVAERERAGEIEVEGADESGAEQRAQAEDDEIA